MPLMDTLDEVPLHQTLVSFASGLEGYWGDSQRAEQVYQACMARSPRDVVQALACGGPWARQATTRQAYGMRKRLAQDAECSFCSAAPLHPDTARAIRQELLDALDTEGRSASLLEHVHSA